MQVAAGFLAANHPQAEGQAYNLSSQGEVTQQNLINALTDALALPRVSRHVPYGVVIRFAFVQELIARMLRRAKPPTAVQIEACCRIA